MAQQQQDAVVVNMAELNINPNEASSSSAPKKKQDTLFGPNIGIVARGPEWTESREKVIDELTPEIVRTWIAKSKQVSQSLWPIPCFSHHAIVKTAETDTVVVTSAPKGRCGFPQHTQLAVRRNSFSRKPARRLLYYCRWDGVEEFWICQIDGECHTDELVAVGKPGDNYFAGSCEPQTTISAPNPFGDCAI